MQDVVFVHVAHALCHVEGDLERRVGTDARAVPVKDKGMQTPVGIQTHDDAARGFRPAHQLDDVLVARQAGHDGDFKAKVDFDFFPRQTINWKAVSQA